MAGDEIIQQFVTELKKNPSAHQFVKSVFGQLKAAANDADGLTAAEVNKISTSAKNQLTDAKNDGIISAEEEKTGSQMIAAMQNLPTLDKATTQKFLNGFDELLDAKTKEEAKKAAIQANEAAPDFFKVIIGFLMQLLGFPPEQVQEFLGQTQTETPPPAPNTNTAPSATANMSPSASGASADLKLSPEQQTNAEIYKQALARLPKPVVSPGDYSKEYLNKFSTSEELSNYYKEKKSLEITKQLAKNAQSKDVLQVDNEYIISSYKQKLLEHPGKEIPADSIISILPDAGDPKFKDQAIAVGNQQALQSVHNILSQGGIPKISDTLDAELRSNEAKISEQKRAIERAKNNRKTQLDTIAELEVKIELNNEVALDGKKGRTIWGYMFTSFGGRGRAGDISVIEEKAAEKVAEQKVALAQAKQELRKQEEILAKSAKELMREYETQGKLDAMKEWQQNKGPIAELLQQFDAIKGQIEQKQKADAKKLADEKAAQEKREADAKIKREQNALRAEASGLGGGAGATVQQSGTYYSGSSQNDQRASIENQLAQKRAELQEAQRELHDLEGAVRGAKGKASVMREASRVPGASSGMHVDVNTSTNTNNSYSGQSWNTTNFQADAHWSKNKDENYQRKVLREEGKQGSFAAQREELRHKIHVLKEDIRFLDSQLLGMGGSYDRVSLKTRERVAELAEALQMPESVIYKSEKLMRKVGELEKEEKLAGMYGNITSQPIKEVKSGFTVPEIDPLKSSDVNKANVDYNRQIAENAFNDTNARRSAARGNVEAAAADNVGRIQTLTNNIGQMAQVEYVKELRVNLREIQENLETLARSRKSLVEVTEAIAQKITETLKANPRDTHGLIQQGRELDKQAAAIQNLSPEAADALRAASKLIGKAVLDPIQAGEDQINKSEAAQIASAAAGLKKAVAQSLDKTIEALEKQKEKTIESMDDLKPSSGGKKPTQPGGTPGRFA